MVSIRPITRNDVPAFRDVLGQVAAERKYLLTLEAPSLASARTFVKHNIEKGYPHFVAEVNGNIVGWADFLPKEKPSLAHCASLGMGVLQGYRRQGIGHALLAAVSEAAIDYGFTRLELEVFANNDAAIVLYLKHGFETEGRKRNARCIDGSLIDTLIMARIVGEP